MCTGAVEFDTNAALYVREVQCEAETPLNQSASSLELSEFCAVHWA